MKKNYNLTLAYISTALMIYSGFNNALYINGNGLLMYNIPCFSIVILFSILYIYGLTINKKIIYMFSYIFNILAYIYSLYIIFASTILGKELIKIDEINIFSSRLGFGTYIYLFSFILFIITIFLQKENTTKDKSIKEEINNLEENNYIFCKYIYGFKELNSLSEGALKINNDNSLSLILLDAENKTQEKKINYNEIKDINIKSSIVLTEERTKTTDNTMANTALASIIIGGQIAPLAANMLSNQMNEYSKIKEKVIYEITIILDNNNVLIQTKTNPQNFVNKLNIK